MHSPWTSIALWERRMSIIVFLGILCLAHWTLLYRTMFIVVAQWEPTAKSCVVVQTNPSLLNVTFFFSTWILYKRPASTLIYIRSNGFWFYHIDLYCCRFARSTLCSDGSLEATFSGWSCVFPPLLFHKLYPSRRFPSSNEISLLWSHYSRYWTFSIWTVRLFYSTFVVGLIKRPFDQHRWTCKCSQNLKSIFLQISFWLRVGTVWFSFIVVIFT